MKYEYIPAKHIISGYMENAWFGSSYNMNIYKGCNHGCIYCDSRSSCYQIENFDIVKVKMNALEIIHKDLTSKRKKGRIMTGSMSDPYNPIEKELEVTKNALKLIRDHRFGVTTLTKSALVLRDIDLYKEINQYNDASVNITITTADDNLSSVLERNVSVSSERFKAIEALRNNDIKAGVLLMPILPFINDSIENIENIVHKAHEVGALWIFAFPNFGVTLRDNQRDYYYQWLDRLYPGLSERYIATYGDRYSYDSPNSKALWKHFTKLCDEYGILYHMRDINRVYFPKKESEQLSLF